MILTSTRFTLVISLNHRRATKFNVPTTRFV